MSDNEGYNRKGYDQIIPTSIETDAPQQGRQIKIADIKETGKETQIIGGTQRLVEIWLLETDANLGLNLLGMAGHINS